MRFREKATGHSFDSWYAVQKYHCHVVLNEDCGSCKLAGLLEPTLARPWESCQEIHKNEHFIRQACQLIGFEVLDDEEPQPADDQKVKADAGKLKLCWVPQKILTAIAYVRMYGFSKYGEQAHHWDDATEERYQNAAYRHWLAYLEDPDSVDEESGLPHLWHLACNVSFLVTKRWAAHFKIARVQK